MIGWIALRTARKAVKGSKSSKVAEPVKSYGEITSTRSGQWAVVIFLTMFVGAVIAIGLFVNYANTH